MDERKKTECEQRLVAKLKEYDENPGTTTLDGIVAIFAEILVRLEAVEDKVGKYNWW